MKITRSDIRTDPIPYIMALKISKLTANLMKFLILPLLLCSPVPAVGSSLILSFDDFNGGTLPNGYQGFQWNKFAVLNGFTAFPAQYATGYRNGVVSPNNVAFNDDAQPATVSSASLFDLNSAYLTAAWNDGLQVEIQGYRGGALLYDNTYTVNPVSATFVTFGDVDIDTAVFRSFGGGNHGYIGTGTQFVMDDLSVTVVPEPGTAAFFLAAVLAGSLGRFGSKRTKMTILKPNSCWSGCADCVPVCIPTSVAAHRSASR